MQWTICFGETQQQATGRVFVLWIILNDPGIFSHLAYFCFGDIPLHSPAQGMAGEVEVSPCASCWQICSKGFMAVILHQNHSFQDGGKTRGA
jgi:hypothetical protein